MSQVRDQMHAIRQLVANMSNTPIWLEQMLPASGAASSRMVPTSGLVTVPTDTGGVERVMYDDAVERIDVLRTLLNSVPQMPQHCRAMFEMTDRRITHLFRECVISKTRGHTTLATKEPTLSFELGAIINFDDMTQIQFASLVLPTFPELVRF